jgi:pyridoxal phosphate enzyme (YggS family)
MAADMTSGSPGAPDSIASRIAAVRSRIDAACERAGRDPADVLLIGVSKTQPIEVLREAVEAGLTDLGENRAREFVDKAVAAAGFPVPPAWHFIGHLQRNKVREVLPHVDVLHSVDSPRLVEEIARRIPPKRAPLDCYLEVNVAREARKEGVTPLDLPALLQAASESPALRVLGLMTVAPRVTSPEDARPVFRALRDLTRAHGLAGLSMGMTEDFEVAIEEGATAIRVGRALFGDRLG